MGVRRAAISLALCALCSALRDYCEKPWCPRPPNPARGDPNRLPQALCKPCHSPATSRRPARPRLSACNWRGSGDERAGAAQAALELHRPPHRRADHQPDAQRQPVRGASLLRGALRLSSVSFGRRAAPARAARRAPPPSTPHLPPPAGSLCEEEAAVLHEARRLQRLPGGACGPRARQATGVHTPPRRPPRTVTPTHARAPPSSHAALRPGRPQLDAFFAPYNELLRELVHPDFHWSDATHAHARRLSQM